MLMLKARLASGCSVTLLLLSSICNWVPILGGEGCCTEATRGCLWQIIPTRTVGFWSESKERIKRVFTLGGRQRSVMCFVFQLMNHKLKSFVPPLLWCFTKHARRVLPSRWVVRNALSLKNLWVHKELLKDEMLLSTSLVLFFFICFAGCSNTQQTKYSAPLFWPRASHVIAWAITLLELWHFTLTTYWKAVQKYTHIKSHFTAKHLEVVSLPGRIYFTL